MAEVTGGNIYLEIGMGAKREPGYSDAFPFRDGDVYATMDLPEPRGIERVEHPGPIIFNSQQYNDTLRTGPFDAQTIMEAVTRVTDIWDLHHFAERKGVYLAQMRGDGRNLPFPDGSVDQILFRDVIGGSDYVTDTANQQQLLAEARRVIAPDGAAVVCADRLTNLPGTQAYFEQPGWRTERVLTAWDRERRYFRVRAASAAIYLLRPKLLDDPYTPTPE
jgi:SAM-dependent methyltransferase